MTSKKRWFAAPDVPTADEAGVPGLDVTNWLGAYAPKGTPKDIVAKLNAAVRRRDGRSGGARSASPIRAWNSAAASSRRRRRSPPI